MNTIQSFFNYFASNTDQIGTLLLEHLQLTVFAVSLAVLLGVPLGILILRTPRLAKPVLGLTSVVQAVPSLALLGFLIPFIGIGSTPAIIMVVLYSLLPIVKNTYTGLSSIPGDTLESAKGIGLTDRQILSKIQLPLALPIIMAGIRISAVTAVGLMTISAFVGAGGLGYLVFAGIQTVDNNQILAGAIPAGLLALLIDFVVSRIEYKVAPNGIVLADGRMKKKTRRSKKVVKPAFVIATAFALLLGGSIYAFTREDDTIVVGSKNFTEQLILGNIVADLIEEETDLNVRRQLNLGGTQVAFSAIRTGEIDTYVEYTGTLSVDVLNQAVDNDPDAVYASVKPQIEDRFDVQTLDPIGFNNTYAIAVKQEDADRYALESISDLAAVSDELVFGPTIEFSNREDGYLGLKETYPLRFKDVKPVDGGLRYTALMNGESQAIDGFSTDGLLKRFELVVLEDDQQFFPPYYAVPLINGETLREHPELEGVLNLLSGRITDEVMQELNYLADVEKQRPEKVARDFLVREGLINE
ncbi:glycine betaine ABC transporter substrate-binding protein [Exiguobacterium alkaliphilum]|uniref:ABC transporter permease/substrate-binding protein n=1 Tax=Exiguobacterium alkaliphilum TaxID=1428684 RepID=UPI001BACEE0E|nr:glycine betaine ABC transporter substrate-binding protein [Exiguobacterium alkaliphilum]QUE87062.1 ABC transporter permease subunit [Exiguobacterium alkaliphilum]